MIASSKPYILVVEDDFDDVDFFAGAFSDRYPHIAVKHIPDGVEVLPFLNVCPVDGLPTLLLLDYKMPVASGPDILSVLKGKAQFSSLARVVWSNTARETEIEECRLLGARQFFAKPATENEWKRLVADLSHYFSHL